MTPRDRLWSSTGTLLGCLVSAAVSLCRCDGSHEVAISPSNDPPNVYGRSDKYIQSIEVKC